MSKKLSEVQLRVMRELLDEGMRGSEVAICVGCSDRAVYERRQRWNMGLEGTAPKKSKKSRSSTATKYWHGHHFGPDLKCVHCDMTHPGSSAKWNRRTWRLCPSAPEPENIEPGIEIAELRKVEQATHCQRGHEFTVENTYVPPTGRGRRQCRACRSMHNDRRKQLAAEEKP